MRRKIFTNSIGGGGSSIGSGGGGVAGKPVFDEAIILPGTFSKLREGDTYGIDLKMDQNEWGYLTSDPGYAEAQLVENGYGLTFYKVPTTPETRTDSFGYRAFYLPLNLADGDEFLFAFAFRNLSSPTTGDFILKAGVLGGLSPGSAHVGAAYCHGNQNYRAFSEGFSALQRDIMPTVADINTHQSATHYGGYNCADFYLCSVRRDGSDVYAVVSGVLEYPWGQNPLTKIVGSDLDDCYLSVSLVFDPTPNSFSADFAPVDAAIDILAYKHVKANP